MIVFLDFEASSLSDESYPIEIGWAGEDGSTEQHLIRPAPGWTDWSATAEAVHRIERDQLLAEGSRATRSPAARWRPWPHTRCSSPRPPGTASG